jgi:hypothetical protein
MTNHGACPVGSREEPGSQGCQRQSASASPLSSERVCGCLRRPHPPMWLPLPSADLRTGVGSLNTLRKEGSRRRAAGSEGGAGRGVKRESKDAGRAVPDGEANHGAERRKKIAGEKKRNVFYVI